MDGFFEELDNEISHKKHLHVPPSSPGSRGAQRHAPGRGRDSRVSSDMPVNKLTLKKSIPVSTGKLRLKKERMREENKLPPTPNTEIGSKNHKNSNTRARLSATYQFPVLAQPFRLPALEQGSTRFIPIGGLRAVGANMNMIQYGDDILLIDGGLEFARDVNTPGCDSILPDIRYLIPMAKKIVAMFITHGHLDHIGGLKHIVPALGFPPLYGSPFTIAVIKKIFAEVGLLHKCKFHSIDPDGGKIAKLGPFSYELFRVNHTIPDSCGIYIETPSCRIMHMGDYKIDFTPRLDKPADLANYARIANRGIDILLQETTNSARAEWTTTELVVSSQLRTLISEAKDRVIVGNFATLMSRIQDVISISEDLGKTVFISGRSMVDHIAIAREMGYIRCKSETIRNLDAKTLEGVPSQRQLVITTGAQGEEYGGLGLMSRGDHRIVSIKPSDTIILSSSVIPGNELAIRNLINDLNRFGPKIITVKEKEVHSGGHGGIIEQKVMISLIKPRIIVPCHGDLTSRLTLKKEAVSMGYDPKSILILEDGVLVEINAKREVINTRKKLPLNPLVVDGQGIGVLASDTMRDRILIGDEGCIIIVLPRNKNGTYRIESRGLFFSDELTDAHDLLLERAKKVWAGLGLPTDKDDELRVKKIIFSEIRKYVMQKWEREPLIVPIFVES